MTMDTDALLPGVGINTDPDANKFAKKHETAEKFTSLPEDNSSGSSKSHGYRRRMPASSTPETSSKALSPLSLLTISSLFFILLLLGVVGYKIIRHLNAKPASSETEPAF